MYMLRISYRMSCCGTCIFYARSKDCYPRVSVIQMLRPDVELQTFLGRRIVVLRCEGFYARNPDSCVKFIEPLNGHRQFVDCDDRHISLREISL